MVLVDGVKYACQQCIKGHRSSKCTHTTRPLVEIKSPPLSSSQTNPPGLTVLALVEKGRPTSQCAHCRELRKTKSVHARCDCAAREAERGSRFVASSSGCRLTLISCGSAEKQQAKVLPNGLVDAVNASTSSGFPLTATAPSGGAPFSRRMPAKRIAEAQLFIFAVTRLLNPCDCLRGGVCTCCTAVKKPVPKKLPGEESGPVASTSTAAPSSSTTTLAPALDEYFANPVAVPPTFDSHGDIVVTPLPQPSTSTLPALSLIPEATNAEAYLPLPPLPPPPPSTQPLSDPLFLPTRTAGTFACFCGPTCACIGCAVHDPYSRKRPAEGGCGEGGGCRCGTGRGCELEESKRARIDGVAAQGKAGGCCGKGKGTVVQQESCCSGVGGADRSCCRPPTGGPTQAGPCCGSTGQSRTAVTQPAFPTSGIELPSLLTASLSAGSTDTPSFASRTQPTSDPLPSLRTLWPAILDLDAALSNGPTNPSALLDDSSMFPTSEQPPDRLQLTACSAMFLEEPLGDACEEQDGGCQCDASCGCKNPAPAANDDEKKLAELAAMGAFG